MSLRFGSGPLVVGLSGSLRSAVQILQRVKKLGLCLGVLGFQDLGFKFRAEGIYISSKVPLWKGPSSQRH